MCSVCSVLFNSSIEIKIYQLCLLVLLNCCLMKKCCSSESADISLQSFVCASISLWETEVNHSTSWCKLVNCVRHLLAGSCLMRSQINQSSNQSPDINLGPLTHPWGHRESQGLQIKTVWCVCDVTMYWLSANTCMETWFCKMSFVTFPHLLFSFTSLKEWLGGSIFWGFLLAIRSAL